MDIEDSWGDSCDRLRTTLRELPSTDPTLSGGKLASWYVVAEYKFEDHASLIRLHGTGPEQQAAWQSLGLLTYALRAEEDGAFGYEEEE